MPFRRRHRLYGPFALYGGRVESDNGCEEMLDYFDTFAATDGDTVLALMGVKMMKVPEEPYIRLAGVLPERERMIAYEAADVTIAPAADDLVAQPLLESLAVGTPVLASARNSAAVEHCRRANAGLYYANREEFVEALRLLMTNSRLRSRLGENGRSYVRQNFRWDAVLGRFDRLVSKAQTEVAVIPGSVRRRETDAPWPGAVVIGRCALAFFRRVPISYRLIISFSVVGLIFSSSAARFCTPPAASSVDSISRFSTFVITSLNEMPSGGTANFGMWNGGAERMWSGIRSRSIRGLRAQHDRSLDHVLQLAHVARPVVVHQHVERVRRDLERPACCSPRRTFRGSAASAAGCLPSDGAAAAGRC